MAAAGYPAVGSRVRLAHDVDRFPHFVAPAGALGTVVYLDADLLRVRLDETLEGAETWDNEIVWSLRDDDVPRDALELLEPAELVRHEALAELDADGLRAVIDAGGPSALVDAARDALAVRLDAEPVHRVVAAYVGERRRTDEAYEVASADVVLALTLEDAHRIADGLELLADLDEGEHVDDDALRRLAALVRSRMPLDRDAAVDAVSDALERVPAGSWLLEPRDRALALVNAADAALDTVPGYIGSVPEGRRFVADVLADTDVERDALAAWLVDELTAE